jgi:hypothetical protein
MKTRLTIRRATWGLTALLLGSSSGTISRAWRTPATAAVDSKEDSSTKPAVVLELFTSEGCSTCPPADLLLSDLQNKPVLPGVEVIAFEEHVDYWNNGGWKDSYSSQQWTQRQESYQSAFKRQPDASYTPQLIVDGSHEIIGSRTNEVLALVLAAAKQPKIAVKIVPGASQKAAQSYAVSVGAPADASSAGDADVMLAVTETGLHSDVKAGENAGKALQHAAVLRRLDKIGTLQAKNAAAFAGTPTVKFDSSWKRENLRIVVFVQEKKTRHILGAAEVHVAAAGS